MTIAITGGLGYIGSHVAAALLEQGHELLLIDNLSNSSLAVLDRIQAATGKHVSFVKADIREQDKLEAAFNYARQAGNPVSCVIHCAALKAVGESVANPLAYYDNNVVGTISLCRALEACGIQQLIFSSSATVYGDQAYPYQEGQPLAAAANPYGQTKITNEYLLKDIAATGKLKVISLRYFNPTGSHPTGLLGEELTSFNNIFPYLAGVYVGLKPELVVFGADYPTADGTCERDYVHVWDLAQGHVKALEFLASGDFDKYLAQSQSADETKLKQSGDGKNFVAINLGYGSAYSVQQIVDAFKKHSSRPIPTRIGARRPGDLPAYYANSDKALKLLGWKVTRNLDDMVRDTLKFLDQVYLR